MGKYNGAVITTAGQNLIAQAIAESKTVTFTTAQASSHVYPSSTNFEALTALTDVESTVNINYAGVYSDTVVQVSARFDNGGVETAYLINTLGFFAQLDSDTPILFAVSTAVTPDQMPVFDADSPSAFIYNIQMTVQNADSVTITVNPAGTITVEQLNTVTSAIETKIGDITQLDTTDKSSTVAAINEVKADTETNATAITATRQLIAPIQTTLTATQDYAIGEQFIYNGLLYEATAAITQGGTITIDGNCELSDSVTEQINARYLVKWDINTTQEINSIVITMQYGWNGLKIKNVMLGCALPQGVYTLSVRNNFFKGKRTTDANFTDLRSYFQDAIMTVVSSGYTIIEFNFNTAPFGTTDNIILINGDFTFTRIS